MEDSRGIELLTRVSQAFSPGAPIDRYALFAGRKDQVRDVINAIMQRGQHVIMFGERGVGKTSLANVLSDVLKNGGFAGMDSGTINCDGTDTFSSLWHKVFREISVVRTVQAPGIGAQATQERVSLNQGLPERMTPDEIRYILSGLDKPHIMVIDELDRLTNLEATRLLADTIKTLSDHSVNATLLLVGVADSVDQLIAEHASVERALVQVKMPRMSTPELFEIIDRALAAAGMTIEADAKERTAKLSQGLPHYTHLLGLHAAQAAIVDRRIHIEGKDVRVAIGAAVDKAQQSILNAYHRATASHRKENLYAKVLLACALARTDDLGSFAAADVRRPVSRILGKSYDIPAFSRHLYDFCEPERGPILQRKGSTRRFRFRFINPLMQPFVIMHGVAKGLLPEAVLEENLP